jgi:hypothetical protein
MQGFAAQLTDEDMKNIAAYSAPKKAKPASPRTRNWSSLGEKIYRGGMQTARSRLRRLPQPERRRHPGPVPAPVRPACRLHRPRS